MLSSSMKAEISLVPEILSSVERALAEDIGSGDVTTNSIIAAGASLKAAIISKQEGVVAGLGVARAAFQLFDKQTEFDARLEEGERVESGQLLADVRGSARSILTAERTALNFL